MPAGSPRCGGRAHGSRPVESFNPRYWASPSTGVTILWRIPFDSGSRGLPGRTRDPAHPPSARTDFRAMPEPKGSRSSHRMGGRDAAKRRLAGPRDPDRPCPERRSASVCRTVSGLSWREVPPKVELPRGSRATVASTAARKVDLADSGPLTHLPPVNAGTRSSR